MGDVQDRDAVVFEDEISTGGTLIATVQTLKQAGVRTIHAGAVHGVLCGPAVELLRAAQIESIVVTNTVHLPPEKRLGKITQLTVGPLASARRYPRCASRVSGYRPGRADSSRCARARASWSGSGSIPSST